ncbi:MAG: hypothetical protein HY926_10825 [Elusimicrobia bacterium]|nr:hypothetical protein [Elusimicrobiota bacterium]
MRKMSYLVLCSVLAAGCFLAKLAVAGDAPKAEEKKAVAAAPAKEGEVKAPEFIKLEKVGKLAVVNFPHAAHAKTFSCKDCHEGKTPLFAQKVSGEGMKMADMKAGKGCGSCHDGKKTFGDDKKKIFASTMCMKCHKPAAK